MLASDKKGNTPLHEAAWNGQLDQVPVDVLTAENMLVKDTNGRTPLHYAASNGHLDQVIGMEFPEYVKELVGEEWWEKNQTYIKENKKLVEGVDTTTEIVEIDLF